MTVFKLIFSLFLFQNTNGFGQTNIDAVTQLITKADSIILVSHLSIKEHHDKRDVSEVQPNDSTKTTEFPSFFVGMDINSAIVMQRQILSKQDVAILANIIQTPVKKSRTGSLSLCFEPHHAILIYTRGHLSYIDFCFHCNELATSSDITLSNMDFIDSKWEAIKSFFLKHGLTYEM